MKRILLMDDSPLFLEVARHVFTAAGYEVACAADLAELDRLRSEKPADLVLMDVQMPEAFGDDIAMTLRFAHDVKTPIYLLSSLDDADLADRAVWAKADGYISKTLGMDGILERVRVILGSP
jgi:DNA-binding response OmpR family regulator